MPTAPPTIEPFREPRRVYCAGPLFNEPERREMEAIAGALRAHGFEPWLPHADGLEFAKVLPYLTDEGYDSAAAGRLLHEAIFALDVYQVVLGCGSLVLNINGRVPDEGAVSEAAIAWTLGKPIVIYKADARSKVSGRDNPLVVGLTRFETVDEIGAIGEALAMQIADSGLDPHAAVSCSPHLYGTVAAGQRLWRRLVAMNGDRQVQRVAAAVMSEHGCPA
ncbi:MAG TPA: nucleoside 2-deoxyribosyltransferase, partial [Pirellulales bacterium]|nr:nucleoside 2-deoxyribosyltransferase [Pirellulales bacterium]